MNQKISLFKKHPIFNCLSNNEKELLVEDTEQGKVQARNYLYKDDNRLKSVYFITSGSILVGKNLGKVNETILQLSMDSVFLGLSSLILKEGNHQYAKALSTVRFIKFNKTVFRYFLHHNSEFHSEVRKYLGRDYFELETRYLRLHGNIKFHNRLKLFLEELHFKNLNRPIQTDRIELYITHLEIAKYLQGSRQSVSLNLARMRDEGLINYNRNWMKVIDLKGIRAWEP